MNDSFNPAVGASAIELRIVRRRFASLVAATIVVVLCTGTRSLSAQDDRAAPVDDPWLPASALVRIGWPENDDPQTGHTQGVYDVAISPDNRLLATASTDETVRVWEIATGRQLWQAAGRRPIAWSPDGTHLAAPRDRTALCLREARTGAVRLTIECQPALVAWSEAGDRLAVLDRDRVRMIAAADGAELPQVFNPRAAAALCFSPDARMLAWRSSLANPVICDPLGPGEGWVMHANRRVVHCAALSPTRHWIACGASDGEILLWKIPASARPDERSHERPVANSSQPAADEPLRTNDLREAEHIPHLLRGHDNRVQSLAFSPGFRFLASASLDRQVHVWELATRQKAFSLAIDDRPLASVALSPDGRYLAAGSIDRTAAVWDLRQVLLDRPPLEKESPEERRSDGESPWCAPPAKDDALDFERCWRELSSIDAETGHRAVGALLRAGLPAASSLIDALHEQSQSTPQVLARLLDELDHPEYQVRQQAEEKLLNWRNQVQAELLRAMDSTRSAEVRFRLRRILGNPAAEGTTTHEMRRTLRALQVLEWLASDTASDPAPAELSRPLHELLDALIRDFPSPAVRLEAQAVRRRLLAAQAGAVDHRP